MTLPSMLKFEPTIKPGGTMLINTSMIHQAPKRDDIKVFEVPVTEMANELGNPRVANIIMLGAFVRTTNIIKAESAEQVIREVFSAKAELIDLELKAFNHWQN
jgi:2-oxoglutarate ferredoxin oxidoreductase subunit gamma